MHEEDYGQKAEDYTLGETVGFGSSALVYSATHNATGERVAIKMIDLDRFERNQIDELRKEIQVMTLCKHENILNVLASFVDKSNLWIVTPFLKAGSCLDIMKNNFNTGFEEIIIACIIYQTITALDYLHNNGHIHRYFY